MPWSIGAAEVAGGAAGAAAGAAASQATKEVCDALDVPTPVKAIAAAVAAGTAHWVAAQGTKAAISGTSLDGVGLVVGIATSPVTAGAHAVHTFFVEIFK